MSAPLQQRDREIAAWFREAATMDDTERDWLRVFLTADQCLEVARVIEGGLSMFKCNPDETDGAERPIAGWPLDPVAGWPLCAVCGKSALEGNHATDLGVGHDYVPESGGARR